MSDSSAPSNVKVTMEKCRPLRDPVRAMVIVWQATAFFLAPLYIIFLSITFAVRDLRAGVIVFVLAIFSSASPSVAVLLLLNMGKRRVVFVRKFKNDEHAVRLLQIIAAALGTDFRLCGIRSPLKRVSLIARLLFWQHAGLQYVGSQYQQLEAEDRDWLARLLKTLQKVDLAIIDLRSATEYVVVEARTCLASLGAKRCVFLVESRLVTAECMAPFTEALRGANKVHVYLVPVSEKQEGMLFAKLQEIVATLPELPRGRDDESFSIVHTKVGDEGFRTAFFSTDLGQFVLTVLITLLIAIVSMLLLTPVFALGVNVLSFSVFAVLFVIAWRRLWRASAVSIPAASNYQNVIRRRLKLSAIAGVLTIAILFIESILIASLGKALESANRIKSSTNLIAIGHGLISYTNENKADGVSTSLGQIAVKEELPVEDFVSPREGGTVPPDNLSGEALRTWIDRNSDYVFVAAAEPSSIPGDVPMIYERPERFRDGICVLFGDYHVEFLKTADAIHVIETKRRTK